MQWFFPACGLLFCSDLEMIPELKNSGDEIAQRVVIAYVDDLLIFGWQRQLDAIFSALLAKYVMKRSGALSMDVPEGQEKSTF